MWRRGGLFFRKCVWPCCLSKCISFIRSINVVKSREKKKKKKKKKKNLPTVDVAFDGNISNFSSESCLGKICRCLCPCEEPASTPQL